MSTCTGDLPGVRNFEIAFGSSARMPSGYSVEMLVNEGQTYFQLLDQNQKSAGTFQDVHDAVIPNLPSNFQAFEMSFPIPNDPCDRKDQILFMTSNQNQSNALAAVYQPDTKTTEVWASRSGQTYCRLNGHPVGSFSINLPSGTVFDTDRYIKLDGNVVHFGACFPDTDGTLVVQKKTMGDLDFFHGTIVECSSGIPCPDVLLFFDSQMHRVVGAFDNPDPNTGVFGGESDGGHQYDASSQLLRHRLRSGAEDAWGPGRMRFSELMQRSLEI